MVCEGALTHGHAATSNTSGTRVGPRAVGAQGIVAEIEFLVDARSRASRWPDRALDDRRVDPSHPLPRLTVCCWTSRYVRRPTGRLTCVFSVAPHAFSQSGQSPVNGVGGGPTARGSLLSCRDGVRKVVKLTCSFVSS